MRPKFVYTLSLTTLRLFIRFAIWLPPLIYIRIWFLLKILRMNRPNDSKSCKHIINDKTYVGNIWRHFSQICNSDTVLDGRQNLFFAQYLEMKRRNETKFCIHIIIDKIYVGTVKRKFSQICSRVGSLIEVRIWF